jgi:hypothetical protein
VKLTPKGARIFSQPNMKKSNSQKKKKKQIWQLKEARSLQYKDIIHEINPKKNT